MVVVESFTQVHNLLRRKQLMADANAALMIRKTRVDAIVDNMANSGANEEQIQDVIPAEFVEILLLDNKFIYSLVLKLKYYKYWLLYL